MMNTKKLNRLYNLAVREAKKSEYKQRLGAVIFKNNKIVSRGFNKVKTHTQMIDHNAWGTIHAECDALLKSNVMVNGMDIFVCRILKDDSIAYAKPCKNCQRILKQCGIKTIYYTINKFPFYDILKLS